MRAGERKGSAITGLYTSKTKEEEQVYVTHRSAQEDVLFAY